MRELYFTKKAYLKLKYYVTQCEDEISGLGKVETELIEGRRIFLVTDLEIFNQEVTAAHSTIDDDALAKFQYEIMAKGEEPGDYKLWWHSHAAMDTFFSTTDTGTIDKSTEFEYLISLVTNHEMEFSARIDVFDPIRAHEELKVVVLEEENAELKELCKKEIENKVTKKVYLSRTYNLDDEEDKGISEKVNPIWIQGKKIQSHYQPNDFPEEDYDRIKVDYRSIKDWRNPHYQWVGTYANNGTGTIVGWVRMQKKKSHGSDNKKSSTPPWFRKQSQ